MPKVTINDSQGLTQSTGNGFVLGSKLILERQTVVAAGSDLATATQIASNAPLVVVTGAGSNKGVKLPAVSGLEAGRTFIIQNYGNATLEVYPGVAGDRIYPATDGNAITVAAYGHLQLTVADATGYFGNEGVIAA